MIMITADFSPCCTYSDTCCWQGTVRRRHAASAAAVSHVNYATSCTTRHCTPFVPRAKLALNDFMQNTQMCQLLIL